MGKRIDISGWFFKIIFILRTQFNLTLINHLVKLKMISQGVKFGRHLRFNGFPVINRAPDSKITFGDNCLFNSSKHSVQIGLYRPCSFVTLKEGAEIRIGNNSGASGVVIVAAKSVFIGDNVLIGGFCTIMDSDIHNSDPSKRRTIVSNPVVIEDNVFLGFNCFILKGVTIGKNSVIGANSVVTNDIPCDCIAIGNPCKIIIKRDWS